MDAPNMMYHRSWVGAVTSVAATKQVVNSVRENWVNCPANRESAFGSGRYRQRPLNGIAWALSNPSGLINLRQIVGPESIPSQAIWPVFACLRRAEGRPIFQLSIQLMGRAGRER